MATVTLEGAVVNRATLLAVGTVTAKVTVAPNLSISKIFEIPAESPVRVKLSPIRTEATILALLLVAV